MKRTVKILILTVFTSFVTLSCGDDWLDESSKTQQDTQSFYATESDAMQALYAAYDPLQWQYLADEIWHFRWWIGDVCSDDSYKGGSGDGDQPFVFDMENFQTNSANLVLRNDWKARYTGIYRSNIVIEQVPEITMDETARDQIIAEAKFLRAFYHFDLVNIFGGVPLITGTLSPSEYKQPKASVEEVYNQIEQDLTEAIPALIEKSAQPVSDRGRVTAGAAKALLTKAYVFQEKWTEARDMALEVINSGEYDLSTNYEDIFTFEGEHGAGSIFEINFSPGSIDTWGSNIPPFNNGGGADEGEGNKTNQFQTPREGAGVFSDGSGYGGWGFNIPTQEFVDAFETDDPRLASTIFRDGDDLGDGATFSTSATTFDHLYYPKKYVSFIAERAEIGTPELNGGSNDRIIRYADLLLWHAEASYHLGDEATAQTRVNEVRARARRGATGGILPDISTSGTSLLDAIYHERRVELGLEGHRWYDIVRTGRAAQLLGAQGLNFTNGVNEIFPIPIDEIIQLEIEQNPGYN